MQQNIGTVVSQFVQCYHSNLNYSNQDYVNQYIISEIFGENHIKLSLEEEKIPQTLSLLKQRISKHRTNHLQNVTKLSYDTIIDGSTVLTHFNKMIGENSQEFFIGAYNTKDYRVDALFPVKNEHHFEEIAEKIMENFNVPSTLIFRKMSDNAKYLNLCVPGINQEPNSQRIYKKLSSPK